MSYGPCFMYYICPACGKKFKYNIDLIPVLGDSYGECPECSAEGVLEKSSARTPDDSEYTEVDL